MFDLIVKNGSILDGTGSPAYHADIAIKDGRIARIARGLTGAVKEIDASGLTVTPGFIDSHAHNDDSVFSFPDQREKIEQGITTAMAGQCGASPAPLDRDFCEAQDTVYEGLGRHSDLHRTMGSFLQAASLVPQGSNVGMFVGHGALRRAAMGAEDRAPTAQELERMKVLLRDALENGAVGLSFGLIYVPGCYSKTDELVELAKVAAEYHALLSAHIRGEGDTSVQAVEEFLTVIKSCGARAVFSHHKASGRKNWGKVKTTLQMIDDAAAEGFDVYCDVYPYNASHTRLASTIVPKALQAGGIPAMLNVLRDPVQRAAVRKSCLERWGEDWSWVQFTICRGYPEFEGKTVPEAAKLHGKDVFETMFDAIVGSEGVCSACYFTMCEEDVEYVIAHPRAMICTDSGVARDNKVYHPRLRGTFPRAIGKYVRERGVVSLPEMIRKITAMPAVVYGLSGKGLVREGMDADLCIFDAQRILDRATFTDCSKRAEGLDYVILGGEIVVENAVFNGKRVGKVLLFQNA